MNIKLGDTVIVDKNTSTNYRVTQIRERSWLFGGTRYDLQSIKSRAIDERLWLNVPASRITLIPTVSGARR